MTPVSYTHLDPVGKFKARRFQRGGHRVVHDHVRHVHRRVEGGDGGKPLRGQRAHLPGEGTAVGKAREVHPCAVQTVALAQMVDQRAEGVGVICDPEKNIVFRYVSAEALGEPLRGFFR